MALSHDIFHSMDCACSQYCVSLQVKINTAKLQMSPSLYLEYIHVVPQRCCGGCTRDYAAPERSMHVIWKVHTYIHSAYRYINILNNTNYFLLINALIHICIYRMCSYEIMYVMKFD